MEMDVIMEGDHILRRTHTSSQSVEVVLLSIPL